MSRSILLCLILCCLNGLSFAQKANTGDGNKEVKTELHHNEKDSDEVIIRYQKKPIDQMYDSIYQWRIEQRELDGVYIPRDLLDAFKQMDKLMEDGVRERFMSFTDEEVDARTHGSLGLWLDHKWKLTDGSRLSAYFNKMGIYNPHHMVGIIIQTYHRRLHNRDMKVKEVVNKFRDMYQEEKKKKADELLENQSSPPGAKQ